MRIGVNLLFLIPGEVGGTETYTREVLAALDGRADEYVLFCNRENAGAFGEAGDKTVVPCPVTARFRPGRLFYEQAWLPRLAKRHGLDALWSPGYTSPLRLPCASVVTIHDLQFRHHPEDFSFAERLATRAMVKISCLRADRVLTDSQASAADITRLGGVPAERVMVAPLAVSSRFFEPVSPARVAELLAKSGVRRPFLLTVANSYPHKNLHGLVRAFGRIETRVPHALVIVGQARRGEAAVQEACRDLHQPERVMRLRGLSEEALRALYQSADAFVFPTLFEGFGLPALEAMAAGAPVACADIPPLREIAGGAVDWFDPRDDAAMSDVLFALLGDAGRRESLRTAGRLRAREFTWTRTAQITREAFAQAVAAFHGPVGRGAR